MATFLKAKAMTTYIVKASVIDDSTDIEYEVTTTVTTTDKSCVFTLVTDKIWDRIPEALVTGIEIIELSGFFDMTTESFDR